MKEWYYLQGLQVEVKLLNCEIKAEIDSFNHTFTARLFQSKKYDQVWKNLKQLSGCKKTVFMGEANIDELNKGCICHSAANMSTVDNYHLIQVHLS